MYEWIPQKTNQKARTAVILLLTGTVALFAITALFPAMPLRWLVQLIAIGMGTAAILLVTRYIAKSYLYRVIPTEGGDADLTVTERKSNRSRMVVCRVALSHIRERLLATPDNRTATEAWLTQQRQKHLRFFDYRADLLPDRSILLLVEEGGETLVLRLSYDPTLYDLLTPHGQEDT